MINANELRIGNWIRLHVAGPQKVKEIKKGNVEFEGIDTRSFYDYSILHGIPLTAELMDKIGLGLNETKNGTWDKEEIILLAYNDGKYFIANWASFKGDDWEISASDIHVEYLHQLQNAYWVASGFKTELEINL